MPISSEDERRLRAESAMRTLAEADRIKSDKGLMDDVKAMAKEQIASLEKVAGKQPSAPAKSEPQTEVVAGLRINRVPRS